MNDEQQARIEAVKVVSRLAMNPIVDPNFLKTADILTKYILEGKHDFSGNVEKLCAI